MGFVVLVSNPKTLSYVTYAVAGVPCFALKIIYALIEQKNKLERKEELSDG